MMKLKEEFNRYKEKQKMKIMKKKGGGKLDKGSNKKVSLFQENQVLTRYL